MSVTVEEYTTSVVRLVSGEWATPVYFYGQRPSPPTNDEVRSHFIADGQVDTAIGQFVRNMLDNGYTVTIHRYSVECNVVYLRTYGFPMFMPLRYQDVYKTEVAFQLDYTTDPSVWQSPIAPIIIIALAIAISLIIVAVGVYFALINLTKQTETHTQTETITNNGDVPINFTLSDGTVVTIPAHSSYTYTKTETTTGPPNWWAPVITIIGVVAVVAGTAAVTAIVLPKVSEAIAK
jgi:hypothetical protein